MKYWLNEIFPFLEFEQRVGKILHNKQQLTVGIFLFIELWFHFSCIFRAGLKFKVLSVHVLLTWTKREKKFWFERRSFGFFKKDNFTCLTDFLIFVIFFSFKMIF